MGKYLNQRTNRHGSGTDRKGLQSLAEPARAWAGLAPKPWPKKGPGSPSASRTQDDLERAAAEIRDTTGAEVLVFAADLDKEESIKELVSATVGRYGQLDVMVNNSGGPPLARSVNATEEQWETALQRSLLFFCPDVP